MHLVCTLLFFLKLLVTLKYAMNTDGQMSNRHYLIILVISTATSCGSVLAFRENIPSGLCLLKFDDAGKAIVMAANGVLSFSSIGIIYASQRHIKTARKACHRKESHSERLLKVRMFLYIIVMAISFCNWDFSPI